ncbi:putative DNA-binding transcriptional regulator [Poriferisphaera corsica]|uniref:Putative DNA-binding transcriptional regulator n=1 Tax=Poriferisphaera corsica TaxID=2528020 RepID=A0A517YY09_9BACT|nr:CerR family C-terminal domain-containing protein [Poriferisphaera corsica]QDU35096.1 putative DNA-binding transcriptional regulator [Poriferisphaera corsica]
MRLDPYQTDHTDNSKSACSTGPIKFDRPEPEINTDSPTKDRLLLAACHIFSKNGYHEATISEICQLAQANIAAVNYHFRDKQTLYVQTIRHAFDITAKKYHPNGNLPDSAPPEDRLAARINAIVRPSFDPGPAGYIKELFAWEMGYPTGLFGQFIKEGIEPLKKQFHKMLRELLGPNATDDDVHFCAFSIISQCHSPLLRMHVRKTLIKYQPSVAEVEALIDHIVSFSLAGIASRRKLIEERQIDN